MGYGLTLAFSGLAFSSGILIATLKLDISRAAFCNQKLFDSSWIIACLDSEETCDHNFIVMVLFFSV